MDSQILTKVMSSVRTRIKTSHLLNCGAKTQKKIKTKPVKQAKEKTTKCHSFPSVAVSYWIDTDYAHWNGDKSN